MNQPSHPDRSHDPLLPASVRSGLLSLRIRLDADPQRVWRFLTEPAMLQRWSPVVPDRALTRVGAAYSSEQPGDEPVDAEVVDVIDGFRLVHRWGPDELVWQLGPDADGTQLQLVQRLSEPDTYAVMTAGWHVCLSVLADLARGTQTPRCVGADAVASGWATLRDRYQAEIVVNDADGADSRD